MDPNGNLLNDIMDKAQKNVVSTLELMISPEFSRLVAEKGGLAEALESCATSVFSRSAIEDIAKSGGIAQLISGHAKNVDLGNGVTLKEVTVNSKESFYLDKNGNLVGLKRGDGTTSTIYSGSFCITSSGAKLINGVIGTVRADGSVSTIEVRNGRTYRIEISKTYNDSSITTYQGGLEGQSWFSFNIPPDQVDLLITQNDTDYLNIDGYNITDGSITYYGLGYPYQINLDDGYATGYTIDCPTGPSGGNGGSVTGDVNYYVAPGVNNGVAQGEDALSTIRFRQFLSARNVKFDNIHLISMFENVPAPWCDWPESISFLPDFGAWFADALEWDVGQRVAIPIPQEFLDSLEPAAKLLLETLINAGLLAFDSPVTVKEYVTNDALAGLRAAYNSAAAKNIAVAYSGSTNPVLKALVKAQQEGNPLNIDTLISWAGPILNKCTAADFAQTSLTTFINCWGSADEKASIFNKLGDAGKGLDPLIQPRAVFGKQENLSAKCKTINIEVLNAKHDYFYYDEAEWTVRIQGAISQLGLAYPLNPDNWLDYVSIANILKEREINKKTATFMADLAKAAAKPSDLERFYENEFFIPNGDNSYQVNLDLF